MTTHPVSATSELVQALILGGFLLWSVVFVLRKYASVWMYRQQAALASYAQSHGFSRLSRWLQPAQIAATGCGSGCNTCGSCAMNPAAAETKPVQWKTPSSSAGCH